ncbi:hypothetical protein RLOC_00008622 [Lonchura striata]|uniref:Uncharacterized protein n=1 Tax=Lonchura striata TaxID=40157 RepID=A0A218UJD5_9PASE|nr:hypothetical protein RLOC_00008622 [Lonchura striata domestica]
MTGSKHSSWSGLASLSSARPLLAVEPEQRGRSTPCSAALRQSSLQPAHGAPRDTKSAGNCGQAKNFIKNFPKCGPGWERLPGTALWALRGLQAGRDSGTPRAPPQRHPRPPSTETTETTETTEPETTDPVTTEP